MRSWRRHCTYDAKEWLGVRLGSDERVVEVQIPAEVGDDWNDVHQLQRNQAGASHG